MKEKQLNKFVNTSEILPIENTSSSLSNSKLANRKLTNQESGDNGLNKPLSENQSAVQSNAINDQTIPITNGMKLAGTVAEESGRVLNEDARTRHDVYSESQHRRVELGKDDQLEDSSHSLV